MSKTKELDSIATAIADHLREIIGDSIDWAVDGTIVSELEGDEYYEAINYIKMLAINKLYWGNSSPVINSLQTK